MDYALVMGSFHFINRIADLLEVPLEAIPRPLRRFEFLRRLTISIASRLLAKMDMRNRKYPQTFEEALENLMPQIGDDDRSISNTGLVEFQARPKLLEVVQLLLEEKENRTSLDAGTLAKVYHTVEKALAERNDDVQDFHELPADPVEGFAYVGTRFAYRTTKEMIDSLRQKGYDDIGLLDLAIAVADANMWARIYRLFDLNANLLYHGRSGF